MALDDYKPLGFYENNLGNIQDGFGTFSEGGEHYFTYNVGNQVYLISEGYASETARDNGINSVKNNMENPDRYKYDVDGNGNHYFSLRAGNNQEIATSRWFGSAADAQNGASTVRGGSGAGTTAFSGDMVAAGGAASISIASAAPAGPPKERKKRKKRKTPKKPKKEKVYLQDGNYPINGVHYKIFRSGNDKHYFTFHREDGKTIFLNADVRGFETEAEAKAMVDEVFKYGPVESNYEGKETRNGKYYFYLKGNEGKNIAKSFFYGTTEDMQKAVGLMLGAGVAGASSAAAADDGAAEREAAEAKAKADREAAEAKAKADAAAAKAKADEEAKVAAASAAAATAAAATAAASKKKSGQDEYLHCNEYKGKSAAKNGFSTFEKDGQYYFALVDNNGGVRLRSQGYTSESGRDNGIESVIKNRGIKDRWSVEDEKGKYFSILKAGNHQEIGRSCPYNDRASAGWIWGAPAAAAAVSAVAAKPKKVKKDPPKKVVKEVKREKAAPVKAAAATTAASSTKGGCAWLWWLLPLLLLGLLLWFLLRGCDGCNQGAAIPAVEEVVEEVKETVAPVDTVDLEAERRAAEERAKAEEAARVQAAKEERQRELEAQRRRGGNKSTGF